MIHSGNHDMAIEFLEKIALPKMDSNEEREDMQKVIELLRHDKDAIWRRIRESGGGSAMADSWLTK